MNYQIDHFIESWLTKEGVNSTKDILKWISDQNNKLKVSIKKISLDDSPFWYYEQSTGSIKNKKNSFFSISGIQQYKQDSIINEQPIILQDEIGLLGIICQFKNGVLHFLMQAKIEPGNINKVQISPTIQATKSNFTQAHGGVKPLFLDLFLDASASQKIVDQIQSEQSSRFYKKRNRNVVIFHENQIDDTTTHKWLTLGQIKDLMKYDNLVNMDTRTVLSCIPYSFMKCDNSKMATNFEKCNDKALLNSMIGIADRSSVIEIFHLINNFKMFNDFQTKMVDIFSLNNWKMKNNEYICKHKFPFKVIFCDITIEGREVLNWTQPLFEAEGIATFGLFTCVDEGKRKFLVKSKHEIGCFDNVELGPTVQKESTETCTDPILDIFFHLYELKENVMIDCLLSEEGGRFYHEQNRNIIIEIDKDLIPKEYLGSYIWLDYKTLNTLVQINNCLNIQLRNLLSLLEV